MSLARRIKRAALRRTGEKWPSREQPFRLLPDGGYETLRPTKGWLRVSGPRRRAQLRLLSSAIAAFDAAPARV